RQAFAQILDQDDPGIQPRFSFDSTPAAAPLIGGARPAIAILREQGVNGQVEMAAAFTAAGFRAVDIHMSDILAGRQSLSDYKGMVACGGFSYGDVLGAGEGWAKSILFNARARDDFARVFERSDRFGLGVCNGCQMMSNLHQLIPGSDHWPHFVRNLSQQFEARVSLVEILPSPSILLQGMEGARLPIAVAHGEGQAEFADQSAAALLEQGLASLRYVDNRGEAASLYPANPNGSALGLTGFTTTDGRFTIMMPHPERLFRSFQYTALSPEVTAQWGEYGPWMRLFRNARSWC
ncbi:MAG: phosphoribosylformylglycinamidine synthase subunit PurQ, partial [Gammaproteobacteria bacterium]|nr:phosphoribosylformylglycinamidine synthase subunit PurQ [Gammaproteobacteria bacterium]